MATNEGSVDRIVRAIVGVALLVVAFAGVVTGVWAWLLGIVGAVLLVTGGVGFCPIYGLLGMRTTPTSESKPKG